MLALDMSAKQWVAHAGLFPRLFQSGSSVNKKTSALSATQHDPHVKRFYLHMIEDNGLTKLQAICAVMRKL